MVKIAQVPPNFLIVLPIEFEIFTFFKKNDLHMVLNNVVFNEIT
jgi:hypothetical protein